MMREFTCIICPNGCEIRAEIEEKEGGAVEILSIEGAACKKGNAYVEQELKDPPEEYCYFCPCQRRNPSLSQCAPDSANPERPHF